MTIKPSHLIGFAGLACVAIAAPTEACPEQESKNVKNVKLVQSATGTAKTCRGASDGASGVVQLTSAEGLPACKVVCDGQTLTLSQDGVVGSFGEPIAVSFGQSGNVVFGDESSHNLHESHAGKGLYTYSMTTSTTDDDEDKTVVVRIEDGEVYVEVNGEQIDAGHIKQGNNKITVLGGDGEVIAVMPMTGGGHGQWAPENGSNFELIIEDDSRFPTASGFFTVDEDHPKVMVGINMGDADFAWEVVPFDPDEAFVISHAIKGLPAAIAGLRSNDLVIEIDGERPATPKVLLQILSDKVPGDEVEFMVLRKGKEREILVELAPYNAHKLGVIEDAWVPDAPEPPHARAWVNNDDDHVKVRIYTEQLALEEAMRALEHAEVQRHGHEQDVERARHQIEEMLRRQESIQRQQVRQGNQQFFVRPDGRTNELENRVDRLERQLDRVEDKLDRILDKLDR